MKLHHRTVGVVLVLFSAVPGLLAQTTGTISGRVRDEQGNALADVRVSAVSPSLQGQRVDMTDRDGTFYMPAMPPGIYEVRAQLDDRRPLVLTGVVVAPDHDLTLDLRLLPAFGEQVAVVADAPRTDVTSTSVGLVVDQTVFEKLPISRRFQDLAFLAPGVVDGGYAWGAPSINGASAAENRFLVDGLDTTDPGFGTPERTLPPEFLEIVEIKTAGFEPEYGGALGGIVNALTRSGSNELHGTAFGYYRDSGFGSDPPGPADGRFLGSTSYDYGLTLGGSILRDRLWYFFGLNPTVQSSDWTTVDRRKITDKAESLSYSGKLTLEIASGHRLAASAFGDPSEGTVTTLNSAGVIRDSIDTPTHHFLLSYNGVADPFFLELSAGRYDSGTTRTPAADVPLYVDNAGGTWARRESCGDPDLLVSGVSFAPGCTGGSFVYEPLAGRRDQLAAAASWSGETGSLDHRLKVGASARKADFRFTAHYPAPAPGPFYDSAGTLVDAEGLAGQQWILGPTTTRVRELDWDFPGENEEFALFLQDQIAFGGNFVFNLGVRADSLETAGNLDSARRTIRFSLDEMIGIRLGIAWDPMHRGRSKIFAHYGRYYESVPLWINGVFGRSQFNSYTFQYPANGQLPSAANPGVLISRSQSAAAEYAVATNLEPQHTDEFLAGVEFEIGADLSVALNGIFREIGDVLEDISVDSGRTFIVANPGGRIANNPATGEPLETPLVFSEPVREYRALQLSAQKRLHDDWQLSASYVYSENEGNYVGLYEQDQGFLAPNTTFAFNLPELERNGRGPLPNDRTHQAKLSGFYQWSFGLVTGLFAQYMTGTPVSKRGANPVYGRGFRFITPRGSAGRTPDVFTVDVHAEQLVRLGKSGLTASVFGDVFNLFNRQHAIAVDQNWTFASARTTEDPNECGGPGTGPGTSCPEGNPNWGIARSFQAPRTFRIGARLTW